MSKRIALFSAAAFAALALTAAVVAPVSAQDKNEKRDEKRNVGREDRHGRRRRDVPSKNIVQNAVNFEGPHHAGGGGEGRRPGRDPEGKGPFTVFAPTNSAFGKLPAGTVDSLVKPENRRP